MRRSTLNWLLTMVLAFVGINASARDWDAPEMPQGTGPIDGATVMLYNVEAELCVQSGRINAAWETSAILGENGLLFKLKKDGEMWQIITSSGSHSGKNLFVPLAEGDYPHAFVDMAGTWQGAHQWVIDELPDGTYSLAINPSHEVGGRAPGCFFGSRSDFDLYCDVEEDEDEAQISWLFLDGDAISIYKIRCEMYELLYEAEEYPTINLNPISEVYDNPNATLKEIQTALTTLKASIAEAQLADYDDINPDNPFDVTINFITNPTFDDDLNGWTVKDMHHDPNGTPYGSEEEGNYVQSFCEQWVGGAPLGREVGISQSLALPAGLYRLSANAIATAQYAGGAQVEGVKLYVKTDQEYSVSVATGNNAPQHYVIEFIADGVNPVEIGFHVDANTIANWTAVDNFELFYLGKTTWSAAYLELKNAVAVAEGKFPADEVEWIEGANATVIAEYQAAYKAAAELAAVPTSADEACTAAAQALLKALEALEASQKDYSRLTDAANAAVNLSGYAEERNLNEELDELFSEMYGAIEGMEAGKEEIDAFINKYNVYNALWSVIEFCNDRIQANSDDEDCIAIIENGIAEVENAWHEGSCATTDEVAALKEKIENAIAAHLNAQIKPGDDLTHLLINPSFEDNANGWDTNGYDAPGGLGDKLAEYFQKNFNLSQTLRSMPKGRYTLTCQGFQRRSTVNAVLYANNDEKLLHHVRDFEREEGLYSDGSGNWPQDSNNDGMFCPNSTAGSNTWFTSGETDEDGNPLYTNILDFFLLDGEKNDVTLGVKSDNNGDWTLVDNFTLTYHGNNAEDYAPALEALIAELNEVITPENGDEQYVTKKLSNTASTAINQAQDAIKNNNADACIAAIPVLKAAIEEAKTTVVVTRQLADDYSYITDYRMDEVKSSDPDFKAYLETIVSDLSSGNIADDAAVEQRIEDLKVRFTQYVQYDGKDATEEKPFDMTAAIMNPQYECFLGATEEAGSEYNAFGWEGDVPNCNEFSAEFFRMDWTEGIDIHQTIKGLAPGWYKLRVQGYNRQGYGNEYVDTLASNADLYAGEYSTRLRDVLEDKSESSLYDEDEEGKVEIDGVTYYYPSNMPTSMAYFEEGYYWNMLKFEIKEGQNEITIGIRKNSYKYWDSVMFDNWQLEYVGATEPTEQETAVENIALSNITSVKYYTLDGVEMSRPVKGVNIIKRTDSTGRVNVCKIMVK